MLISYSQTVFLLHILCRLLSSQITPAVWYHSVSRPDLRPLHLPSPNTVSLLSPQIYGTFNRAMLRMQPALKTYAEPLTSAMVEFYLRSQQRFTQDMQPHYVYSPREMTRWVRGICEAIRLGPRGVTRHEGHERGYNWARVAGGEMAEDASGQAVG